MSLPACPSMGNARSVPGLLRRRYRCPAAAAAAACVGLAVGAVDAVRGLSFVGLWGSVGRDLHVGCFARAGLACAVTTQFDGSAFGGPAATGAEGAADESFQEALSEGVPLIVDFTSPGCGPCHAMGKVLDHMQQEFAGKIHVLKLPIHKNAALASGLGVNRVPTVLLFGGGSTDPVHRFVGAAEEQKVRRRIIQKLLS